MPGDGGTERRNTERVRIADLLIVERRLGRRNHLLRRRRAGLADFHVIDRIARLLPLVCGFQDFHGDKGADLAARWIGHDIPPAGGQFSIRERP